MNIIEITNSFPTELDAVDLESIRDNNSSLRAWGEEMEGEKEELEKEIIELESEKEQLEEEIIRLNNLI